jgi:hypothetical protein
MNVFTSKLVAKDGDRIGQIAEPETKEKYNTRFHQVDKDKWRLDVMATSSRNLFVALGH